MSEMKKGLQIPAQKENDDVKYVVIDFGRNAPNSNVPTVMVNNSHLTCSMEIIRKVTTATKYYRSKNSVSWGVSSNRALFKPYKKCDPKIREILKNYKPEPIRYTATADNGFWEKGSLMPDGKIIITASSDDKNIEKNEIINEPKDEATEQLENVVNKTESMNINEDKSISED